MKHLYILALGGLLSFSAQAQFNQPSAAAKEDMAPRQKVTNVQTNVERETIWTNDISDCATWSFGNGSMEELNALAVPDLPSESDNSDSIVEALGEALGLPASPKRRVRPRAQQGIGRRQQARGALPQYLFMANWEIPDGMLRLWALVRSSHVDNRFACEQ